MPVRYSLILGTFLLSMLLYVDRVCISTAKKSVADDLGFSDEQMAWVFAAFSLGYALFQTPSGLTADRFGSRRVLTAVVAAWSVFTALTAAAYNFVSMLVIRFMFGAGEAGAFPGITRAFFSWLPVGERGLAHGITFSGTRVGGALALAFLPGIINTFGWRETFVVLGIVGVVWSLAWYWLFRDDPATHPLVSDAERQHILSHRQQATIGSPRISAWAMIGSLNMWLAMGQYFASNFTFFFCLTWLPSYLADRYDVDNVSAGWYAAAPLVAGMFGNWFSGALVDALFRGGRPVASRRLPAIMGFVLAAAGMYYCMSAATVQGAAVGLTIAVFGADMTLSPSWSFCTDIGRSSTGTVSGTMNMAGNIGAFVTALAFAYLKQMTGSVNPFFLVGITLNLLAIIAWLIMNPNRVLGGTAREPVARLRGGRFHRCDRLGRHPRRRRDAHRAAYRRARR